MIKSVVKIEMQVEDKVGSFFIDYDTPILVAKEMCFGFIKYLGQIEDNAKAALAEQAAEKASEPQEQPKEQV